MILRLLTVMTYWRRVGHSIVRNETGVAGPRNLDVSVEFNLIHVQNRYAGN